MSQQPATEISKPWQTQTSHKNLEKLNMDTNMQIKIFQFIHSMECVFCQAIHTVEDSSFLGYDAVQLGKQLLMFQMNFPVPSSGQSGNPQDLNLHQWYCQNLKSYNSHSSITAYCSEVHANKYSSGRHKIWLCTSHFILPVMPLTDSEFDTPA